MGDANDGYRVRHQNLVLYGMNAIKLKFDSFSSCEGRRRELLVGSRHIMLGHGSLYRS